jgi:ABC-type branched-subunit amino acid transport system substrate-binding protein
VPRAVAPPPRISRRRALAWFGATVGAAACGDTPPSGDSLKLGLLLPFTGRAAGPSHNHERAVLLGARELQAVGVGGKRLEIVFGDTHSDLGRGLEASARLLDQGVVAIIAADTGELAQAMRPLLAARGVLLISPEIAPSADGGMGLPWFRLAPSTKAMAESLARHLTQRNVRELAVLKTEDGYNSAFAQSFTERYAQLGGRATVRTLPDDRRSYGEVLPEIAGKPDVLLAARAETAARLVNEMWSFGGLPHWYLTPALRADVFVRNASPAAVAGATGVSPNVTVDPAFAERFQQVWDGDVPLEGALFYFDAIALFALGTERAMNRAGTAPTAAQIAEGMLATAFNSGILASWADLAAAITDARAGTRRYYRGLTGSLVLMPDGQRVFGQEKLWTVSASGEIKDLP